VVRECARCHHHRPHIARGYCSTCYRTARKHGFQDVPAYGTNYNNRDHDTRIAELTRLGGTAAQIADQLGITERTVTRARSRTKHLHKTPPPPPVPRIEGDTMTPVCRTNPDAWADPPHGTDKHSRTARATAIRGCTTCPMLDACTRLADTHHTPGQILAGRWIPPTGGGPLDGYRPRGTHCSNGHEYTPDNTAWRRGYRRCLACNRAHQKAWKAKTAARGGQDTSRLEVVDG